MMKSEAYLAVNPMGKVPAIRRGDTVVTEAAATRAWLADAFPEAGLAPPAGDRQPESSSGQRQIPSAVRSESGAAPGVMDRNPALPE